MTDKQKIEVLKQRNSTYRELLLKKDKYIQILKEQQDRLYKDYVRQINDLFTDAPKLFYLWIKKKLNIV